jgi:hypothetical protein
MNVVIRIENIENLVKGVVFGLKKNEEENKYLINNDAFEYLEKEKGGIMLILGLEI